MKHRRVRIVANEQAIWDRLFASIQNPYGVAGVMGNFQAESAMRANNLQDSYQNALGMNDEQYTAAVDNGSYENFVHDRAGYGLYQATYWSIKEHLLNYAKAVGKSVGDWEMQVDQFVTLLQSEYTGVWQTLLSAQSVRQASDAVLLQFERPADQSEKVQVYRARLGQEFFDQYADITEELVTSHISEVTQASVDLPILKRGSVSIPVANAQALLIHHGYYCGGRIIAGKEIPDGDFGLKTEQSVKEFQRLNKLVPNGAICDETWKALLIT